MKKIAICQSATKSSEMDGYQFEMPGVYVVENSVNYPTWTCDEVDDGLTGYNAIAADLAESEYNSVIDHTHHMPFEADAYDEIEKLVPRISRVPSGKTNWNIVCDIIRLQGNGTYAVTHIKDDAGNDYTVVYDADEYDESDITGDFADQIFDHHLYYDVWVYEAADTTIAAMADMELYDHVSVKIPAGDEHPEIEIQTETAADAVLICIDGRMQSA